jgi:hypothetical protein
MESLWQDVRHALRQFRTQRQFTIAALLVLGLGIGANATIFTVVDRVLLTPLPYRAPDDLVMIWEKNVPSNFSHNVVNPQNYLDWKDRSKSFSDMAAFTWSQMVLLGGVAAEGADRRDPERQALAAPLCRGPADRRKDHRGVGREFHRGGRDAGGFPAALE